MRESIICALFLSFGSFLSAQTVPPNWKTIKDSKGTCQLAVPPDWAPFSDGAGAAVWHDPTTAIAVVTSQPGQAFKVLTESQIKQLGVPKEKIFENTARRLLYQDKVSVNSMDTNGYSAMVPGKAGTCSCHLVAIPTVTEETARKIISTLGPAGEEKPPS